MTAESSGALAAAYPRRIVEALAGPAYVWLVRSVGRKAEQASGCPFCG
jgi:hypothetical protein